MRLHRYDWTLGVQAMILGGGLLSVAASSSDSTARCWAIGAAALVILSAPILWLISRRARTKAESLRPFLQDEVHNGESLVSWTSLGSMPEYDEPDAKRREERAQRYDERRRQIYDWMVRIRERVIGTHWETLWRVPASASDMSAAPSDMRVVLDRRMEDLRRIRDQVDAEVMR